MTDSIVDICNIDTSILSFSNPKAHASGSRVVNLLNTQFKESLTIAMPLMLTWGAQEGKEQGTDKPTGKWTMSLQFPSQEYSTPDAVKALEGMKAIDTRVKREALAKSKEWFGKEIKSEDVIEEKFNAMLKYPKKAKGSAELDYNKPPTLGCKIPQWSGVWKTEIYDEEGEPLFIHGKVNPNLSPLEFLKPKTHVIALLQCGGLWFVNGKVSITWNLKQVIVQKPRPTMEGTCFLKPKASDKELMKVLPPPEDDVDPDGVQGTTIVDDSDDEREYPEIPIVKPDPVPQPEPEPVSVPESTQVEEPKAKPKVVRKKKVDA
jgi:hypothetical protein